MADTGTWQEKVVWQERAYPHTLHEEVYPYGGRAASRRDFLVTTRRAACVGLYERQGDGPWAYESGAYNYNFDPTHPKTRVMCTYHEYIYWDRSDYRHKASDEYLESTKRTAYKNALEDYLGDYERYSKSGDVTRIKVVCVYPHTGDSEVLWDTRLKN